MNHQRFVLLLEIMKVARQLTCRSIDRGEKSLQQIPGDIALFFDNLEAFAWEAGNLVSVTADDL